MLRPLDDNYWLGHCHGFEVDTPEGRLGVIEDVVFRSTIDRPDTLLIRGGLLGTHLFAVSVDDVEEIAPAQKRIVLRRRPEERPSHRQARLHLLTRLIAG